MQQQQTRPCGPLSRPDGSVLWRLWAPRARQVDLVLTDGQRERSCRMTAEDRGYFTHAESNVPDGQRYTYRLDGGAPRPDPASRWQPDGIPGPSAVVRPERFSWTDRGWTGLRRQDLVFYELHVGTFTPEGTFEAIIPRLDSLRRLGVTALQLMPVAQFPGKRNWGYDGVLLYAPQNSYGGPHRLARLVDACHGAGLAVFLDVVYNHLGPEGNYLGEFGPYFTDRYHTFWGSAMNYDGAGSDAVRDFILDNVRMWVADYHFDGLRLDAVHAIYDGSPRHILRDAEETAEAAGRAAGHRVHMVAESDLNDVRLLLPPERGGFGLDAQWSDDFHHAVHAYLTGERHGYYADFGPAEDLARVLQQPFLYDGVYSRSRDRRHGAPPGDLGGDCFVVGIQNHDQVGNRARGDRLDGLVSRPARRLAASLLLLAPHLPLLFMGEEYGEEHPFLFFCSFADAGLVKAVREGRRREFAAFAWQGEVPDPQAEETFAASRLTWSWEGNAFKAGLRRLYADLLTARRRWPALQDFNERTARLLSGEGGAPVLELVRGGRRAWQGSTIRAYFNLTERSQALPGPMAAGEELLFCSEASRYGGGRKEGGPVSGLLPYECVVLGPAGWEKFV
jgi:maltooligosyltrehalose trehalohydrolase